MTMVSLPLLSSSTSTRPLIVIIPLPVVYALFIPSLPQIVAPVGKSGPGRTFIISSMVMSGLPMSSVSASTTSPRLWGGMLVAIPTAMPEEPFIRRLGTRLGRTTGSSRDSSKLGMKSTVSFSMSASNSIAIGVRRASVYLIAAGGSPSIEPKFPCPLISG